MSVRGNFRIFADALCAFASGGWPDGWLFSRPSNAAEKLNAATRAGIITTRRFRIPKSHLHVFPSPEFFDLRFW
jgi:hypothetical protein